jgi:HSP20 family molecular chaperone IbpA
MSDRNDLARTDGQTEMTQANQGGDLGAQRAAVPAVDIFEDSGGITLLADMPGVSRDRLDVRLDGDTLVIDGAVEIPNQLGMSALWAEVNVPRFRRMFTLSRELDTARIEANVKDGVLSLRIPKQAQAQPRRIAVQAG